MTKKEPVILSNPAEGTCSVEKSNVAQYANSTIARSSNKKLPKINEGDPCTRGFTYMMYCNHCQCTETGTLICTKMACAKSPEKISNFIKNRRSKQVKEAKKSKLRKNMNRQFLPVLPKGRCVPGRTYQNKCKRCFCNHLGKSSCSLDENGACRTFSDGSPHPIRQPSDVRPPFKREELKRVQELASASTKCEPGMTYKVTCNHCICTERNNLICTKLLCLSFDDINRVEAKEKSGKSCAGSKVTRENCVECSCNQGKTACKQIMNCIAEARTKLSKGSNEMLKMEIDALKDRCVPGAIYTDNCNRCYCQPDSSLRCTQKTCLNFAQSRALDEQFKRMKENEEEMSTQKGL